MDIVYELRARELIRKVSTLSALVAQLSVRKAEFDRAYCKASDRAKDSAIEMGKYAPGQQ